MSNLDSLILHQKSRIHFIKTVAIKANEQGFTKAKIQVIATNLELLNMNWEKFNAIHEKIYQLPSSRIYLDYHDMKMYDKCLSYYSEAKAALLIERDQREELNLATGAQLGNVSAVVAAPTARSLPEITLGKFSGEYLTWKPFQDMFTSVISKHPNITNVEKLHYLKTSLEGEAAQLIANLSVSGESFKTAWDLLVNRYENKRLLYSAQLDNLCSTKIIAGRLAKEINSLLNSTTEAISALTALGAPTQHWDILLVHLIVRRLDSKTREIWEMKLGSSTDPPTLSELLQFLTVQARGLENLELNRANPTGST